MNKLKPIKTIAAEILLYFYWLQRQDVTKLSDSIFSFELRHLPQETGQNRPILKQRTESILNINKFKQYKDIDLLNALIYLYDCGFINYNESSTNMDTSFINIRVTATGVDIIEGIEHGQEERSRFNITFNFDLTNNITVESLLKAELGSLIKASLI